MKASFRLSGDHTGRVAFESSQQILVTELEARLVIHTPAVNDVDSFLRVALPGSPE